MALMALGRFAIGAEQPHAARTGLSHVSFDTVQRADGLLGRRQAALFRARK